MNGIIVSVEGFDVSAGGFLVKDSDAQNIGVNLKMSPGHNGIDPYQGVKISDFVNASGNHRVLNRLKRRIKLGLKRDGAEKVKVDLSGFPTINVSGSYE